MYLKSGFTCRIAAIVVLALAVSPIVSVAETSAEIERLVSRYHELDRFNGTVLVADQGEVVFSAGLGSANLEWGVPNGPDTKFRIGSLTKQFTSMLVMQLVAEGTLSMDSVVSDLLPYYRKDTGSRVTLHQLLSHTSGLSSYHRPPGVTTDPSRNPDNMQEYVETYCSGDLEFEPGSQYQYSNTGYRLLGAIVEEVSGISYEELLEERIFKPLGMAGSGYEHEGEIIERRASGYFKDWPGGIEHARPVDMSIPYAAGALYSTAEDLLRWDTALYGESLLSERWKAVMFDPVLQNYACGWRVESRPIGAGDTDRTLVSHSGGINGFHTTIARVIDDRYLIVLLNNTGAAPLTSMRNAILDILYGREPAMPKPQASSELVRAFEEGGADGVLSRYRELREHSADDYAFGVSQLNRLCYLALETGDLEGAIEICTLNVEEYPESPVPYDTLGEAYMEAGEKGLAVVNYARSLERDPGNENAVRQLNRLLGIE